VVAARPLPPKKKKKKEDGLRPVEEGHEEGMSMDKDIATLAIGGPSVSSFHQSSTL
jgi:hypothetical protein